MKNTIMKMLGNPLEIDDSGPRVLVVLDICFDHTSNKQSKPLKKYKFWQRENEDPKYKAEIFFQKQKNQHPKGQ